LLTDRTNQEDVTVLATTIVEKDTVLREILTTGIIKSEEVAIVKTGSRFTGVIAKLHVKLGYFVEKGQLIAELDNREQQFECGS
jgi:HlyD family secretion protein